MGNIEIILEEIKQNRITTDNNHTKIMQHIETILKSVGKLD